MCRCARLFGKHRQSLTEFVAQRSDKLRKRRRHNHMHPPAIAAAATGHRVAVFVCLCVRVCLCLCVGTDGHNAQQQPAAGLAAHGTAQRKENGQNLPTYGQTDRHTLYKQSQRTKRQASGKYRMRMGSL